MFYLYDFALLHECLVKNETFTVGTLPLKGPGLPWRYSLPQEAMQPRLFRANTCTLRAFSSHHFTVVFRVKVID